MYKSDIGYTRSLTFYSYQWHFYHISLNAKVQFMYRQTSIEMVLCDILEAHSIPFSNQISTFRATYFFFSSTLRS